MINMVCSWSRSSISRGVVSGEALSDTLLFRALVQELIKLALSKYLKLRSYHNIYALAGSLAAKTGC